MFPADQFRPAAMWRALLWVHRTEGPLAQQWRVQLVSGGEQDIWIEGRWRAVAAARCASSTPRAGEGEYPLLCSWPWVTGAVLQSAQVCRPSFRLYHRVSPPLQIKQNPCLYRHCVAQILLSSTLFSFCTCLLFILENDEEPSLSSGSACCCTRRVSSFKCEG